MDKTAVSPSDALVHDPNGGMPRLLEIMRRLRHPETGCPWDIEQSFATIAPYTIEEAYEVADAIERENMDALKDELGDLLFVLANLARMLSLNAETVLRDCNSKFERRFKGMELDFKHKGQDIKSTSLEEKEKAWKEQKIKEKS